MAGQAPLEDPPLPIYPAGDNRVTCPICGAADWIWRPDGSRLCFHCLRHRSVIQPNTNGDVSWCPYCTTQFWTDRERYLATRR